MKHEEEIPSRRKFLRNTALTALSAGLLPAVGRAKPSLAAAPPNEDCFPITQDYYGQGPFYKKSAPEIVDNQLASPEEPGTRLILSGRVYTLDCTKIIPDTKIDIWHANEAGEYDTGGFNLRGVTYSNEQAFYLIETIVPGKYLNGALYRPSHLHFKITPPGEEEFITQLYFEGDVDIPLDPGANPTSGEFDASHRIIPLTLNSDGKYEGTWDIVIDGQGTVGTKDLHLDKGMIYSASPNPFRDRVEIRYGVFRDARVSIEVFDMQGRQIAILNEETMQPQKYTAIWEPDQGLPSGHYWAVLKVNSLQVHYLKMLKA